MDERHDDLPPGQEELPADGRAFVAEIHRRVDLRAAWEKQVRSEDPKIRQRALEKLAELDYKNRPAKADDNEECEFIVPPRGSVD